MTAEYNWMCRENHPDRLLHVWWKKSYVYTVIPRTRFHQFQEFLKGMLLSVNIVPASSLPQRENLLLHVKFNIISLLLFHSKNITINKIHFSFSWASLEWLFSPALNDLLQVVWQRNKSKRWGCWLTWRESWLIKA